VKMHQALVQIMQMVLNSIGERRPVLVTRNRRTVHAERVDGVATN